MIDHICDTETRQQPARLWGGTVGGVVEMDDGAIVFEYDERFRGSGLEISPVHLPLSLRGPVSFDELRRKEAFRGLPGVLADALPDAFGTRVIRAYYTARGQVEKAFSPVQHLLYVGTRAIGALSFHPAEDLPPKAEEAEALEVAALVADARRIITGDAEVAIPEIYRVGSSAGGMRPKAVVLLDACTREIRSAFMPPGPDDVPAILKFDGVGDAPVEGKGTPTWSSPGSTDRAPSPCISIHWAGSSTWTTTTPAPAAMRSTCAPPSS